MVYQKDFTTTYTINGREYTVTAPALFDSTTDELLPNKELDDKAAEIARQLYREEMGLITPEELKKYRAKIGLSQRNLAELTGLSPNTVALYEAGAFPTTANNKLLKALINNDKILQQYIIDDSGNYSDELVSKINFYFQNENDVVTTQNGEPKYTAIQLANWFRVENYFEREFDLNIEPITQMKVIKLLYMAYGRYLAMTRNRLFSSPIIHMQYGPVITEVHDAFKSFTVLDQDKPSKVALDDYNTVSQDSEISELLNNVNQDYITYNAARLSKLTHQPDSPWSLTPDRMIIKDQLIFDTFSRGVEK
ncbi:type II toxin-antitoxin system antitoxin SocA domain-containing protein [Ligilactobacillus apodemi]|uniref:Phage associated protein n=1 Tax=Ligilactobacillus apodemi DSM 16634 = JCM 16172 TaxID=1423724 RepID=A0A0R1TQT4_9LACO|nr:type II toxin-antitoxin system antitoxin SocA domain-containing protein [Ligilactobacillus apodemi]KRL83814.1 phage associated protein [Ligilactobacillus apodemi DSM 16634 = JCM 16172]